jgi:hypothetical protein
MSSSEEPVEDMNGDSFQKLNQRVKDRSKVIGKSVKFTGFESWVVFSIVFCDLGLFCFVESGPNQGDVVETSGSDEGDPVQTGR